MNSKFKWQAGDVDFAKDATKAFDFCADCAAAKACAEPIQDDKGRFAGCKRGKGSGGSGGGGASASASTDAPYKDTRKDWNATDAYDELSKEIGLRKGRQTEEEIEAVKDYTTRYYTRINGDLRLAKGDLASIDNEGHLSTIKSIDSAISKTTVKKNMIVHRGAEWDNQLVIGATIKDHAFVSTSTMQSTAEGFAQYPRSAIYHIKLPAGSKASFVAPKSDKPQEQEVLLPRGLTYRVVGITHRSPYRSDVDLEIINGE